jgi:DNA repair photolyase
VAGEVDPIVERVVEAGMIKEMRAKVLLAHVKQPDSWFGMKYNMNLYRGCQHQCIYCDSRSACYQIEDFRDVLVKVNAIELLRKELASKRVKGTVGTGSMHDPYMPAEARFELTGRALEVMAEFGFPVHINTKSDLILRDVDRLCQVNRVHASVCFSITTAEDELGRKLEPGAALVSERFKAMEVLAAQGIAVGVAMMPILPFIEDNVENVAEIVRQTAAHGGRFIIPWFGMSLRDRQRAYYYEQLDRLFPGLRSKYERRYGEQYHCPVSGAERLAGVFEELCAVHGIGTRVERYEPEAATQLNLI